MFLHFYKQQSVKISAQHRNSPILLFLPLQLVVPMFIHFIFLFYYFLSPTGNPVTGPQQFKSKTQKLTSGKYIQNGGKKPRGTRTQEIHYKINHHQITYPQYFSLKYLTSPLIREDKDPAKKTKSTRE